MATRRTAAKAEGKTADTLASFIPTEENPVDENDTPAEDTGTAETVVAEETTDTPAVEESIDTPESTVEEDVTPTSGRDLTAFLTGETPTDAEPETAPVENIDTENALDFGGRTLAVVLFHRYNALDGTRVVKARRGDVIKAKREEVDRGVKLGALREIEND